MASSTGASLTSGGAWTNSSSAALEDNLTVPDEAEIVKAFEILPLYHYNSKSEPESVKHLTPVAEDFYAGFGLGNDDKALSPADLAAVQGVVIKNLLKRVKELESKLATRKDN
jgi:hypothetical protein